VAEYYSITPDQAKELVLEDGIFQDADGDVAAVLGKHNKKSRPGEDLFKRYIGGEETKNESTNKFLEVNIPPT
jgi:hypothetical protein